MTNMNDKQIKLNFLNINKNNPIDIDEVVSYEITGKKFIYYGKDNKFPLFINNLYLNSPILQGVVDTISDYVLGEGITFNNTQLTNDTYVNARKQTLEDIVEKIIFDFILYGGFSLNVIRNKIGQIVELYHVDYKSIRVNKELTKCYVSKDWCKWGSKYYELPFYEINENNPSSIIYYNGNTNEQYPIPMYHSSIRSISNLIEVDKYHSSSLTNDFSPSMMLSFQEGKPTIEEQGEIESQLNKKWSGASNAGKLLVTFSDGPDTSPKLQHIEQSDWGERYNSLITSAKENVYTSFRISSVLVGGTVQSTGFNALEFKSAFVLYNKTMIKPLQKQIERLFNNLLPNYGFKFITFDTSGFENDTNNNTNNII